MILKSLFLFFFYSKNNSHLRDRKLEGGKYVLFRALVLKSGINLQKMTTKGTMTINI